MSVYTDKHGRKRPRTGKTLFGPPKNEEAARRIKIDSPKDAEESVSWLDSQWSKGSREHRVKLVGYANEASNRAKVISESDRVSKPQREEAARVSRIYRTWTDEHKGRE